MDFAGDCAGYSNLAMIKAGDAVRLVYAQLMRDGVIQKVRLSANPIEQAPPEVFIDSTRDEDSPHHSPDGQRVILMSDRSGLWQVWICDMQGASCMLVPGLAGELGRPKWSPDGQWILYESNMEGGWELFVTRPEGGQPRRLTRHKGTPRPMVGSSWSRDSKWVYFFSPGPGGGDIWKTSLGGGEPVKVTQGGGFIAQESWDGRSIYYIKDATGPLLRMPAAGGPEEQVLPSVYALSFIPDREEIWFVPYEPGRSNPSVRFYAFKDRKVSTRSAPLDRVYGDLTLSPDGRYALYTHTRRDGSDLMLVENFR